MITLSPFTFLFYPGILALLTSIVNYSPLLNNKVILVRLKTKVIFRLSSLTTPLSPLFIYTSLYICPIYHLDILSHIYKKS